MAGVAVSMRFETGRVNGSCVRQNRGRILARFQFIYVGRADG